MAPSQGHARKECSKHDALHSVSRVFQFLTYVRTYAHCLLDGVCFVHLFYLVSLVRMLGVPAVLGVLGVFGEPGVATYVVSLSPWCSWMHLSESGSQPRRRWAQWLAQCTCDIIA
jgi:hypothetical protein